MTTDGRTRILRACLLVIRPIARALLANGISYKEFDNACRSAFVAVASEEFGLRGRETNTSRISAMTGLSRKEVQRLRAGTSDAESNVMTLLSPLADLLHVWATSAEYLDNSGQPAALGLGNRSTPSFDDLVRACIGDVPPGAAKQELIRLGVVEQTHDYRLRLLRRTLIPPDAVSRLESAFVYSLRGLAETVAHNSDPRVPQAARRFERYIESPPLSEREITELRSEVYEKLVGASEELDSLLSTGRSQGASSSGRRIGIGIFYFDQP